MLCLFYDSTSNVIITIVLRVLITVITCSNISIAIHQLVVKSHRKCGRTRYKRNLRLCPNTYPLASTILQRS